jgi:hypothetical protein
MAPIGAKGRYFLIFCAGPGARSPRPPRPQDIDPIKPRPIADANSIPIS